MFNSVTLEISLKPFKNTDSEYIKDICSKVFMQWYPLIKNRNTISIMLWVGDGSEILDFTGNLYDEFEWAYFLGTANNPLHSEKDHFAASLHQRKRLYTKNPPIMTYKILKEIVQAFKEQGQKLFPNSTIRVGETFDIGPEFAISDFKYNRHTEISTGSKLSGTGCGFIDATKKLNKDDKCYAAYKNGVPQDTPFGTFFGKQAQCFFESIGFDYIWLSNGLGFSSEPWSLTGKIFDGEKFHPERLEKTRNSVFEFWKLFRKEFSFPIETRGTNNTAGIDYATDGVPLYDIYNGDFNITPPPNSPWAALNDNIGLEIMGHMTRNCELPGKEFKFRYYIHDPWWVNSPWYDRYNSTPYDIYLPMAVSRIDKDGNVQSANDINFLSIDNSFGDLPDNCVYEPLPHILKAEKDCSDEASPFVLIYPLKEFTTTNDHELLSEMYYGDNFMCKALNSGLPLNCVISSENFISVPKSTLKKSVLITPVQTDEKVIEKLNQMSKEGFNIICYASKKQLERLEDNQNIMKVDIGSSTDILFEKLKDLNYNIEFKSNYKTDLPSITIGRCNNALTFSIYNRNTSIDTYLKLPLGAPILDSFNVEIQNGKAKYNFTKSTHSECRVFVKQEKGIVSVKEFAPCSGHYRRRVLISGLENATVYFFPETYCKENCDFANADAGGLDAAPILLDTWKSCYDEKYGYYYKAENISGNYYALMPFTEPK